MYRKSTQISGTFRRRKYVNTSAYLQKYSIFHPFGFLFSFPVPPSPPPRDPGKCDYYCYYYYSTDGGGVESRLLIIAMTNRYVYIKYIRAVNKSRTSQARAPPKTRDNIQFSPTTPLREYKSTVVGPSLL